MRRYNSIMTKHQCDKSMKAKCIKVKSINANSIKVKNIAVKKHLYFRMLFHFFRCIASGIEEQEHIVECLE